MRQSRSTISRCLATTTPPHQTHERFKRHADGPPPADHRLELLLRKHVPVKNTNSSVCLAPPAKRARWAALPNSAGLASREQGELRAGMQAGILRIQATNQPSPAPLSETWKVLGRSDARNQPRSQGRRLAFQRVVHVCHIPIRVDERHKLIGAMVGVLLP